MKNEENNEAGVNCLLPTAAPLPLLTGRAVSEDAKRSLWLALAGAVFPLIYALVVANLRELHLISALVDYGAEIAGTFAGLAIEYAAFRLALRARSFPQARASLLLSALVFALYSTFAYSGALTMFAWYGTPTRPF